MGNVSVGNQKVLWRYKTPLMGSELARSNYKIWYPGVYDGLVVSKFSDTVASVVPGSFVINEKTDANAQCVKILVQSSFNTTIDTSSNKTFLIARFEWGDVESNGADFLNVAYTDILPNDVVLAKFEFTGDFKISIVDNASKTWGMNHNFDNLILNLQPTIDNTSVRKINVASGRFVYKRQSYMFTANSVVLDVSVDPSGRWDLISVDPDTLSLIVTKGVEGGGIPAFITALPDVVVHVRQNILIPLGSDIIDVRPFMTFSGVMTTDSVVADTSAFIVMDKKSIYERDVSNDLDALLVDANINTVPRVVNDLQNRISEDEKMNLEQSIAIANLDGKYPQSQNTFIELFQYEDNKKDLRILNNEDNTAHIMCDNEWDNNWRVRENEVPIYKQGFLRSRKQYQRGEEIDRFTLQKAGQIYKHNMSHYDTVNQCYWVMTSDNAEFGELLKIDKNFKNNEITILGSYFIKFKDASSLSSQPQSVDVTQDGNWLIILFTTYSGSLTNSSVGKISINKDLSGVHDGTLGANKKPYGSFIFSCDSASWTSGSDFKAVNDLNRISEAQEYHDVTIWDSTYFAILRVRNNSGNCIILIEFIQIADNGAGVFSISSPRSAITKLERLLYTNYGSRANIEWNSYSFIRNGNDLWVKINCNAYNQRFIRRFTFTESGGNYSGDIVGIITGTPVFVKSSERLYSVARDNAVGANPAAQEGITFSYDGHLLEMVSAGAVYGDTFLVKRAIANSVYVENHCSGEYFWGDDAQPAGYVIPSTPYALGVEISGGNTYYWTGDYGVTAAQLDIYRYSSLDNTMRHCRFVNAGLTQVRDIAIDTVNDKIYFLLYHNSGYYFVALGSLSALLALPAFGSGYSTSNTITIGTNWGAFATGISLTNTDILSGIEISNDNNILYLINSTGLAIDTLSLNGNTWTKGVYKLIAPVSNWFGLAYKNQCLYIVNITNSASTTYYIYELDLSLSTSIKGYFSHIYREPSFLKNAVTCPGIKFEGNDLVCLNPVDQRFTKIKTLQDPAVMQISSFINGNNVLPISAVYTYSKITERYWNPEDFAEFLDGKVLTNCRRNVPDKYYMVVAYNANSGGYGFTILNLDEFLNSDTNITVSGMRRYDVRKIRTLQYNWVLGTGLLNSFAASIASMIIESIVIERDIIFVGSSTSSTYCRGFVIDLKNGKSEYVGGDYWSPYNFAGNYYLGTLSQRNSASLLYGGQKYIQNLDNMSLPLASAYYPTWSVSKTFIPGDYSGYSGAYPLTVIMVGINTYSVSVILIEEQNNQRYIKRIFNNVFNSVIAGITFCISDDGYVWMNRDTDRGKWYKSRSRAWEINSNLEWDIAKALSDSNYSSSGCLKRIDLLDPEGTSDIGNFGAMPIPVSFKKNGKWYNKLFTGKIGDANAQWGLLFFDQDKGILERVNYETGNTYKGYYSNNIDIDDELIFGSIGRITGSYYSESFSVFRKEKQSFIQRYSETDGVERTLNNWKVLLDVYSYLGNVYNNPCNFYAPYVWQAVNGEGILRNRLSFAKKFDLLSYNNLFYGMQFLYGIRGWMNNSKYESNDIILTDNPAEVSFKKVEITKAAEVNTRISITDGSITWDPAWTTTGGQRVLTQQINKLGYIIVPIGYSRVGIHLERNTDTGIALISVYNITDSLAVLTQESTDLYQTSKEDFIWWANLDPTKSYRITIEHSGSHNASAGSPYSLRVYRFIWVKAIFPKVQSDLITFSTKHASVFTYSDLNSRGFLSLVKQQTFNGTGSQRIFTLTGDNRAYAPVRFSKDGGVTWIEQNNHNLTWGNNASLYNNNLIDSNGYMSVNFDVAPIVGTNNVIIEYIPWVNRAKVVQTLKLPQNGSYIDNRQSPELSEYGIEFIKK
jgi:hypothetical protein